MEPKQIARKALDATVLLVMKDANGRTRGPGSGFFVLSNQIATNLHVIEGASSGTAKRVGLETKYNIEGITAIDEKNDLAILQVLNRCVDPLLLGDSNTVEIGETVYVAGNPQGWEGTFSNGIISGIRERSTVKQLQMTAPISRGSSGGPVLNENGEVIGVSVRTYGGQNLNFATPSNALNTLLSAYTYYKQGNADYVLGSYSAAIQNYDNAIQRNPYDARLYIWRGLAKDELGQHTAARTDYNAARRIKNYIALKKRRTREVYRQQYSDTIADYDIAIQHHPDNAMLYAWRGFTKSELGQPQDAITDYNTVIRLKPDCADVHYNRGNANYRLRQHQAAISDYNTVIHLDPHYTGAYVNRGRVKADSEQHRAAIRDYDTAIRVNPDYAYAYYYRGVAKYRLGHHQSAITDYNTAIRLKRNYAYPYVGRGLAKADLGRHIAAIRDYDTAIRVNPDCAYAYYYRGVAKYRLGRYQAAITDYNTVIRLKPDDAAAYVRCGLAQYRLNRTREARRNFQTALRLAERSGNERLKVKMQAVI